MSSNSSNPVGRPTKYKPEIVTEVDKYLKTTGREQMKLPTIEGFAIYLGVSRDSLYEWKKKYSEFSDALEKILLRQVVQLIDDGIYGGKEVNASIVKLMLQNNHGFKERFDQTTRNYLDIVAEINGEEKILSTIPKEFIEKYDLTAKTDQD